METAAQSPVQRLTPADTATALGLARYANQLVTQAPDSARFWANEALDMSEKLDYPRGICAARQTLGSVATFHGNYIEAFEQLYQALDLARRSGLRRSESSAIAAIGTTYSMMSDFSEAALMFQDAFHIAAQIGDADLQNDIAQNLGATLQKMRRYDEARYFIEVAHNLSIQRSDTLGQALALFSHGNIDLESGAIDQAGPRLMAAAELFQQLGNPYYYGNCQGKLSRLYAKTDQWEMSLQHALLAIQYAEQTQNPRLLEEGHHLAAEANLALKNYKTAADYFHLAWQEHNLLENEDVRRHITELRTQYEVARKQSEINALNIQKKEDEFAFFAAGLAAFLMLLLALAIFRHYRSAKRFARVSEAQKAELEQSNNIKDALFSIVSHELRNPLNSIKAFIELRLMSDLGASEKHDFERLDRQISDTLTLLDNLLDWSAVQTQRIHPRIMQVPLGELLEETLAVLHQEMDRKGVSVRVDVPAALTILGDAHMVRAVLRNLLHNAIKFSPLRRNAIIVIAARANDAGKLISIDVHNEGEPIPSDLQSALFVSGYSTPGTAGERGAGIGLQLCKEFVEKNGGSISFVSRADTGTTFTFTLPAG